MRAPPPPERQWWIGIGAAAAAFWCIDLGLFRAGTPHLLDDTWEYAVAARHLLAGDGFVTSVVHPPLWGLADAAFRVPLLIHGPLLPAVFAGALALLGPGFVDHAAWLSAAFATLAAVLAFRLGARLVHPAAGAAAALLYTISPLTIEAVHHDIALTAGAALLAASLLALARGIDAPGIRGSGAAWAGALLGLGYLVRPEFLLLAPLVVTAAGRGAGRALAAFALVALPWWIHHALAVGSPLFNLSSYLVIGYHGTHPDLTVLRDFDITPSAWPAALREALPTLPGKWAETFPRAMKRALMAPTAATGALALLGGLLAWRDARLHRAALWAGAAALIPITVMTLTIYDERYLSPFLPMWCVAAAAGAAAIAARMPAALRAPRVWIALLAVLAVPSAAPVWRAAAADAAASRRTLATERAALARTSPAAPARPMFSDAPDFTAWTTARAVVWVTRGEYAGLPDCAGVAPSPARPPCKAGDEDVRFRP
jgi:hypothetical protein